MYGFFAYLLMADPLVRTVAWGLYLIILLAAAWFNARAAMHPLVGAPIGIAITWVGAIVFLLLLRLDHPWGQFLTRLILLAAGNAPSGQGPLATYGANALFGVLGAWLATYRSGTVPIRKRQRKYWAYRY